MDLSIDMLPPDNLAMVTTHATDWIDVAIGVLTTQGLGLVAIGFAFKNTFENCLAGVLILLRKPFQIEDDIASTGVEGQVQRTTFCDTHIRQTNGQLVLIPTVRLFQNPVTVRPGRTLRRTSIICG